MDQQLDMFADAAPDIAQVVDVKAARADGIRALEILMYDDGDLLDIFDALPPSVFLSPAERKGPIMARARWCYCLSPRQDQRPGCWPVVCIDDAAPGEERHPATIINHGDMVIPGYTQRHGTWQIRTEYAVYDMAGRFKRHVDAEIDQ